MDPIYSNESQDGAAQAKIRRETLLAFANHQLNPETEAVVKKQIATDSQWSADYKEVFRRLAISSQ